MPKEVERAKMWRMNHAPPRKRREPASTTPDTTPIPSHSTSWPARIQRLQALELEIHDAIKARIKQLDAPTLAKLQANHVAAIREIAEAEKLSAEAQVVVGELIPAVTVRDIIRQGIAPLRDALDRLPIALRSACNPDHPEVAEAALTTWRDNLLVAGSALEARLT